MFMTSRKVKVNRRLISYSLIPQIKPLKNDKQNKISYKLKHIIMIKHTFFHFF